MDLRKEIEELKEGLSEDQLNVFNHFVKHAGDENRQLYVYSGTAGTGKTVLLARLVKLLEVLRQDYHVAVYTGQAVSVLRDKNVSATTIHRMMYTPRELKDGTIIWIKREYLDFDWMIIDEFSMISKQMLEDMISYGTKIIFFGDPFQLPPIGEDDSWLANKIDYNMTQIQRQAEGNPIIQAASKVRQKNKLTYTKQETEQGKMYVLSKAKDAKLIAELKLSVDQIISGTNKTRRIINREVRKSLGRNGTIDSGDRLIILKNNAEVNVYNGQQITAKDIGTHKQLEVYVPWDKIWVTLTIVNIRTTDGETHKVCLNPIIQDTFNVNTIKVEQHPDLIFVDYAYCANVHKMQGSTFKSTLVYADDLYWMKRNGDMYDRGLYTAITRASHECYVVI